MFKFGKSEKTLVAVVNVNECVAGKTSADFASFQSWLEWKSDHSRSYSRAGNTDKVCANPTGYRKHTSK